MATDDEPPAGRPKVMLVVGAVVTAAAVVVVLLVDPILGAFLAIMGVTLLGIGAMARTWDQHPSYEDRELARARRRKEKWDRNAAARARDRARWEAHQAKQAKKADSGS
jgi:hypothetical protein